MVSVECSGCGGYCCKVMLVQMQPDDKITAMRLNFEREFKFNGHRYAIMESICKHLQGNRCGVYDRRPQRCRDFPRGEEELWRTAFPECGMLK